MRLDRRHVEGQSCLEDQFLETCAVIHPAVCSQLIAELMKPSVARDARGAGFLLSCEIDSVHNRGEADDGL